MQNLKIEQTLDSREVAELVEKKHYNLIRDIKGYVRELGELKIEVTDFFRENTYKTEQNKTLPRYDITKKGCEFIAHKLTGIKGTEFTARYINRFHDMEEHIVNPLRNLSPELQAIFAHDRQIQQVKNEVDNVRQDLEDFKMDLPILGIEIDKITSAVHKRGVNALGGKGSNAYSDKSIHNRLFQDIYRELKRQFGVSTYKAIKRNQCDYAVQIIEAYEPPLILTEQIRDCNAQVSMEV